MCMAAIVWRLCHNEIRLRHQNRMTSYWCAGRCRWVTGHSYIVYGPLMNGATTCSSRVRRPIPAGSHLERDERYKISILYTSPTAIRTLMPLGRNCPRKHD